MDAENTFWQGRDHSLNLRLPPLSVVGFKRLAHAPGTGANVTELLPPR